MASFGYPCPKISTPLPAASHSIQKPLFLSSFSVSESKPKPALTLTTGPLSQGFSRAQSDIFRAYAQLQEAAADKLPNATLPILEPALPLLPENQQVPVSANSITAFMAQVTDLVKLVDSKDIVELELKQLDCEVVIRKKEALPQSSFANPVLFAPPSAHQAMPTPQVTTPSAAPAPVALAQPAPKQAAPINPKSSHPPFKSPMAGNFYRSSAPNAPPFVKVGDKVQKGQVLCIIEAMKLMNEIEADQSGSIVEILIEDGKPVSFDTPLFVIEP